MMFNDNDSPNFDEENEETGSEPSFGRRGGIIGTAVDIAEQEIKHKVRKSLFEEACTFVGSFFGGDDE